MNRTLMLPRGLLVPDATVPTVLDGPDRAREYDASMSPVLDYISEPRDRGAIAAFLESSAGDLTVVDLENAELVVEVPAWGTGRGRMGDLVLWPVARATGWAGADAVHFSGQYGAGPVAGIALWAMVNADGRTLAEQVEAYRSESDGLDEQVLWSVLARELRAVVGTRIAFLGGTR